MSPRRLRTTLAVSASALVLAGIATPADAATPLPAVPTIEQVASVYPHLAGGSVDVSKVEAPRLTEDCDETSTYAGSRGRFAWYTPSESAGPEAFTKPNVIITAMSFRKKGQASRFLEDFTTAMATCAVDGTASRSRIKVRLGDASKGLTVSTKVARQKVTGHVVSVRSGKVVVTGFVVGAAKTNPTKKAVALARAALAAAS